MKQQDRGQLDDGSASSIEPARSCSAPVNVPFRWPKSSDSTSSDGIAPQFTTFQGPDDRGLASWIARARSSLPVPDSPRMSTGTSSSWDTLYGVDRLTQGPATYPFGFHGGPKIRVTDPGHQDVLHFDDLAAMAVLISLVM